MRHSWERLRQSHIAVFTLVSYTQPQNALKILTPACHLPVMDGNFVCKGQTMLFAFCIITGTGIGAHSHCASIATSAKNAGAGIQSLDVQNKGIHIPLRITDQGRRIIDSW